MGGQRRVFEVARRDVNLALDQPSGQPTPERPQNGNAACGWRLARPCAELDGQHLVEEPALSALVAIGRRFAQLRRDAPCASWAATPARLPTILGAHLGTLSPRVSAAYGELVRIVRRLLAKGQKRKRRLAMLHVYARWLAA